jgi:hypothetical protein
MTENNYIPKDLPDYDGKQIYLGTGRLILNAKDDSLIFIADKSVSIQTEGTVNIDSKDYTIINSPKIYLGLNSYNESQPLLLGQNSYDLFNKIISSLESLSNDLVSAISTPTGTPIVSLTQASAKLKANISVMKTQISKIKSKKNFTE